MCVSDLPVRYKLIPKPNENQMAYKDLQAEVFYVWDNVAIALHVEKGQVLSPHPHSMQQVSLCDKA